MDRGPIDTMRDSPRDVAALLHRIELGCAPKYLLFWGHRAKRGDAVGKHVLSQWWPVDFEIDAVRYRSAEHYMMAEKARMFADEDAWQRISAGSQGQEFRSGDMGGGVLRHRGARQRREVRAERAAATLSPGDRRQGAGR